MSLENDATPSNTQPTPVDIDKHRWDQSTFLGRLRHFVQITNPLLSLKTDNELDDAAQLVKSARYH